MGLCYPQIDILFVFRLNTGRETDLMDTTQKTVYGPVQSWRVGNSLGVDVICVHSVCSFRCIYCQLGTIVEPTAERREFVSTGRVLSDFAQSAWQEADIITYSGSGEPTLATNLGDVARGIRQQCSLPQLVLTNGVHLNVPDVEKALQEVDRVFVKLDAPSEPLFQRMNRPVEGVTRSGILENIRAFRKRFTGHLGIQVMVMPLNRNEISDIADELVSLQPDEVQLNTPTRPFANEWSLASRGGHSEELRPYESTPLKPISREDAELLEAELRSRTGLPIRSVYQPR